VEKMVVVVVVLMEVEMVDVVELREKESRKGCLGGEEVVAT